MLCSVKTHYRGRTSAKQGQFLKGRTSRIFKTLLEKISHYCNEDMDKTSTIKEVIWMNGTVCRVGNCVCLFSEHSRKMFRPNCEAMDMQYPQ